MGINRTNLNSSKETRWQSGIPRCTGFSFFSHNNLLSCNSTIKCNNITNVTFNLWHLQLQSDNHNSSQCPLCQFPCVSLLWQWCVCALPVWQSSVLTLSICYYSEHLQTSFSSPPSSLTSHCPHKFQTEFPSIACQIRNGAPVISGSIASLLKSTLLQNPPLSHTSLTAKAHTSCESPVAMSIRYLSLLTFQHSVRGVCGLQQNSQTLQSAHPPEPKVQHMWMLGN